MFESNKSLNCSAFKFFYMYEELKYHAHLKLIMKKVLYFRGLALSFVNQTTRIFEPVEETGTHRTGDQPRHKRVGASTLSRQSFR